MTSSYDDKILEFTPSSWNEEGISTNELIKNVHGNKTLILKAIKDLESNGYLESRKVKNTIEYKRKDMAQTETQFNLIFENTFEWNQEIELDVIDKTVSITKGEGIILTKKGKELLDHIQDEVDRAYMVIVRLNYQVQLGILPNNIAQPRIKRLENHIRKIMTSLQTNYPNKAIKEYFQNHVKKFEFKI